MDRRSTRRNESQTPGVEDAHQPEDRAAGHAVATRTLDDSREGSTEAEGYEDLQQTIRELLREVKSLKTQIADQSKEIQVIKRSISPDPDVLERPQTRHNTVETQEGTAIAMPRANASVEVPTTTRSVTATTPSIEASTTAIPGRLNFKVDLPVFKGRLDEDVRSWITLIEDQFIANNVPDATRAATVSSLFRDNARTWYLQRRSENGDVPLTWSQLKMALVAKYDSPERQAELRLRLRKLRYKSMDDFITRFEAIVIQLPNTEMTYRDKLEAFLAPLPIELRHKIRMDRPKDLEEMYASAREWRIYQRLETKEAKDAKARRKKDDDDDEAEPNKEDDDLPTREKNNLSTGTDDVDIRDAGKINTIKDMPTCFKCEGKGHIARECRNPSARYRDDHHRAYGRYNDRDRARDDDDYGYCDCCDRRCYPRRRPPPHYPRHRSYHDDHLDRSPRDRDHRRTDEKLNYLYHIDGPDGNLEDELGATRLTS